MNLKFKSNTEANENLYNLVCHDHPSNLCWVQFTKNKRT